MLHTENLLPFPVTTARLLAREDARNVEGVAKLQSLHGYEENVCVCHPVQVIKIQHRVCRQILVFVNAATPFSHFLLIFPPKSFP